MRRPFVKREAVPRKKKILMISKALTVAAYHGKLVELAKRNDIDLVVVMPAVWSKRHEKITPNGYKIIYAKVRFPSIPHIHYYPDIKKIIRDQDPDIIHIDEEHYVLVTYQVLKIAKKLKKKALFFTWQNIDKRYPFPFSAIENSNLKNSDAAIAGNREAKRILERKGVRKRIFVIPQFGVDETRFRKLDSTRLRRQLGVDGSFTVGYLGRLVREKGIDDLVRAIAISGTGVRLLVIGGGPFRKDLIRIATEAGVEKQLKSIDHVLSTEVAEYLNCLDCLALPSVTTRRWKEQFGRVLIEAMACGVPVIGSNSGEIPNVIGNAGLIFKERNHQDLAEKIAMLRDNADLRLKLSRAGRERVLSRFTHKMIADQTYQAYQWLSGEDIY